MKSLAALALFLALSVATQAKLAPFELQRVTGPSDDLVVSARPADATLERDYFRAPQPAYHGAHAYPCRLQLRIFDKMQLAQSCH